MQSIANLMGTISMNAFEGMPALFKPLEQLTRMDDSGFPAIVQRLQYDRRVGLFRALYFDGTSALVQSTHPTVTYFGGSVESPTLVQWLEVEAAAIRRYHEVIGIKKSLSTSWFQG